MSGGGCATGGVKRGAASGCRVAARNVSASARPARHISASSAPRTRFIRPLLLQPRSALYALGYKKQHSTATLRAAMAINTSEASAKMENRTGTKLMVACVSECTMRRAT
jgi:hypothetical protein